MLEATKKALQDRKVDLNELATVVWDLQQPYVKNLTQEECLFNIERVLDKREVQHAILTGIAIDVLAEEGNLPEPLLTIIRKDEALYGIDEILALSITNVYGSIGLTNFGYLDKVKPGIIGYYDNKKTSGVHTFLDDLLCAIAAAACSRIAHQQKPEEKNM